MPQSPFPEFIQALPQATTNVATAKAYKVSGDALALFYEVPEGSSSPPTVHCDEWGLVIDGRCDVTIDGVTTSYGPGDTFFIAEGTEHSVVNHPGLVGICVFSDPDRFAKTS